MKALPADKDCRPAPAGEVGRILADVMGLVDRAIDRRAKAFGVTGPQWIVLMRIDNESGNTAAALCRSIGYDSGSMTRMLDRLVALGLIRRERSASDRRVVRLTLTEKGKTLHRDIEQIGRDVLNDHLRGFSPGEIEMLINFLLRMLKNGGSQ